MKGSEIMGICYMFYHPETLEQIDEGKYTGMPFFDEKVNTYGIKRCAMKYEKKPDDKYGYTKWTIDEDSELFKDYYQWGNDYWTDYISRECALLMQKDMTSNNTLFTDLMDEYNCDSLIMDVSY